VSNTPENNTAEKVSHAQRVSLLENGQRPAESAHDIVGGIDTPEGVGFASAAGAPYLRGADWWRSAVFYQIYPKSFADGKR